MSNNLLFQFAKINFFNTYEIRLIPKCKSNFYERLKAWYRNVHNYKDNMIFIKKFISSLFLNTWKISEYQQIKINIIKWK